MNIANVIIIFGYMIIVAGIVLAGLRGTWELAGLLVAFVGGAIIDLASYKTGLDEGCDMAKNIYGK